MSDLPLEARFALWDALKARSSAAGCSWCSPAGTTSCTLVPNMLFARSATALAALAAPAAPAVPVALANPTTLATWNTFRVLVSIRILLRVTSANLRVQLSGASRFRVKRLEGKAIGHRRLSGFL